jgi:hypothetical protein
MHATNSTRSCLTVRPAASQPTLIVAPFHRSGRQPVYADLMSPSRLVRLNPVVIASI